MRHLYLLTCIALASGAAFSLPARSQGEVFRCTDEEGRHTFTDDNGRRELIRKKSVAACERLAGPIASVPAYRPPVSARAAVPNDLKASPANFPRVDESTQRARDSDRRRILEDELKIEESRLAQLRSEYNNGQPALQADESRGSVRVAERAQRMLEQIQRVENNISSLRRELALART
jgi:hypothetical protein